MRRKFEGFAHHSDVEDTRLLSQWCSSARAEPLDGRGFAVPSFSVFESITSGEGTCLASVNLETFATEGSSYQRANLQGPRVAFRASQRLGAIMSMA